MERELCSVRSHSAVRGFEFAMERHDACTQLAGRNCIRAPAMGRYRLSRFCPVDDEATRRIVLCLPRHCDDGGRISVLGSKLAIRTFFSVSLFFAVSLRR